MSDADQAFEAAKAEIRRVREAGGTHVDLAGESYRALTLLPDEISKALSITTLNVSGTKIADLSPLSELVGLCVFRLNRTPVSDLTPIAGLGALNTIGLDGTRVTDLAPLANLPSLFLLSLNDTQATDLAPLAQLSALTTLYLNDTQVTDLAPLARLSALTALYLNDTQITDLAPLAQLTGLIQLHLSNTRVSDLAPLAGLSELFALSINGSNVQDLRPLIATTKLGEGEEIGLWYEDTPASRATPELARLSKVGDAGNYARCYRDTIAYLKTLPPYPEPLPWNLPTGEAQPEDPPIPGNRPAPLQVIEEDGVLRPAHPGDALEADGSRLAEQGWTALREFLEDLADQRERIDNSMPQLGKALARLEAALGTDYAATNSIAIGTHGQRVIRQSAHAPDMLLEADAADIQEFAAALALLLERFPEWRDYRNTTAEKEITEGDARDALPSVSELSDALKDRAEIDPNIPKELDALTQDVKDAVEDPLPRKGIAASISNVLAPLAERLLPVWRKCKEEAGDVGAKAWDIAKKGVATSIVGTAAVAGDIFFNKAAILTNLAAKFPDQLGWVLKVLQALGIG